MWCGGVLSRKGRFESLSGRECERWETSPGTGHPLKVPFPGYWFPVFSWAMDLDWPASQLSQPSILNSPAAQQRLVLEFWGQCVLS